jgi:hypothetical protein
VLVEGAVPARETLLLIRGLEPAADQPAGTYVSGVVLVRGAAPGLSSSSSSEADLGDVGSAGRTLYQSTSQEGMRAARSGSVLGTVCIFVVPMDMAVRLIEQFGIGRVRRVREIAVTCKKLFTASSVSSFGRWKRTLSRDAPRIDNHQQILRATVWTLAQRCGTNRFARVTRMRTDR